MRQSLIVPLWVAGVALCGISAGSAPAAETRGAAAFERPTVVLELFTSQSCASCPPADELLSQLGYASASDVHVIPLAFHVDYWNYNGWRDPFSKREWSERQTVYARKFPTRPVYTPQLIINGVSECIGSDRQEVQARIGEARTMSSAVEFTVTVMPPDAHEHQVKITMVPNHPISAQALDVMVAIFENHLTTQVTRGENAWKSLQDDFVVRTLTRAYVLSAQDPMRQGQVTVTLDPMWKRADLGVVVFAQDPTSLQIAGASARMLVEEPSATAR